MAANFVTTFSNAFSWIKIYKFRLRFHWSLLPRVQLTIFHHCFRQWLGAGQATSHYLDQWLLVYSRIYASLGLNELIWWQLELWMQFVNKQIPFCYLHCFTSQWINSIPSHVQSIMFHYLSLICHKCCYYMCLHDDIWVNLLDVQMTLYT